jgi:hypothetical protein
VGVSKAPAHGSVHQADWQLIVHVLTQLQRVGKSAWPFCQTTAAAVEPACGYKQGSAPAVPHQQPTRAARSSKHITSLYELLNAPGSSCSLATSWMLKFWDLPQHLCLPATAAVPWIALDRGIPLLTRVPTHRCCRAPKHGNSQPQPEHCARFEAGAVGL